MQNLRGGCGSCKVPKSTRHQCTYWNAKPPERASRHQKTMLIRALWPVRRLNGVFILICQNRVDMKCFGKVPRNVALRMHDPKNESVGGFMTAFRWWPYFLWEICLGQRFVRDDRGLVARKDWRTGPCGLGFSPRMAISATRPHALWTFATASNYQSFGLQLHSLRWQLLRLRCRTCHHVWTRGMRLWPSGLDGPAEEITIAPKPELLIGQRGEPAKCTKAPGWVFHDKIVFGTGWSGTLRHSLVGTREPHASWATGSCIRSSAEDFATWPWFRGSDAGDGWSGWKGSRWNSTRTICSFNPEI